METGLKLLKELDKKAEEGYLRRVTEGDLVLYNYTDKCTFDRAWDDYTLNARGTVYNMHTGQVIAQAFPKFFNFEELSVEKQKQILQEKDFEVYEKADGSLGIIYFHNGTWHINTRGSFQSDQAVKGREILRRFECGLNTNYTYLVEIIYPDNRIILDYGDREDLILLAVFNPKCGGEMVDLENMDHPFPTVEKHKYDSIESLIDKQLSLGSDDEGFVVRFRDGSRVKFKSKEYLKLAKILSGCSPLTFWESMTNGKVDQELLEQVPEEFRPELDKIVHKLEYNYFEMKIQVMLEFYHCVKSIGYDPMMHSKDDFRKPLGLLLKNEKFKHQPALFPYFLAGDVSAADKYIMKQIRPTGNQL